MVDIIAGFVEGFSAEHVLKEAKHDVMDWTGTRGWLNLPVGLSMEHEIYKASNTLRNYLQDSSRLDHSCQLDLAFPVLKGAKGLAVVTVIAGVLVAYNVGTGLVIARRSDGIWCTQSTLLSVGLGCATAGFFWSVVVADLRARDSGSGTPIVVAKVFHPALYL
ncbi:hypothetical protein V6N13_144870 [Hibiscus sabdariffa]